jgi:hypothetical protein
MFVGRASFGAAHEEQLVFEIGEHVLHVRREERSWRLGRDIKSFPPLVLLLPSNHTSLLNIQNLTLSNSCFSPLGSKTHISQGQCAF